MGHTHYQNLYHLIWSTKNRKPLIPKDIKKEVFEYIGGAFRMSSCFPIQVGGVCDHVHIFVGIPPKYAISEVIRDVKICTTKWIKSKSSSNLDFAWQEGFGSFSVSNSKRKVIIDYILNQEIHHKNQSFEDEFIIFLKQHGIEYNEKYIWD